MSHLPSIDKDSIEKLTSYPFNLDKTLVIFLAFKEPFLVSKMLMFDPMKLSSNSETSFRNFAKDVETFIKKNAPWLKIPWDRTVSTWDKYIKYGFSSGPIETIAAMILAGAAINKEVSVGELRKVHPSLLKEINNRKPHPYKEAYKSLKLADGHSVKKKIKKALKKDGTVKYLKLGYELHDLSLDVIERKRIKFFGQDKRFEFYGQKTGYALTDYVTEWRPSQKLTAPDIIKLKLNTLTCELLDDTKEDNVFAISYFSDVENIKGLYNQIDTAIKKGNYENIELDIIPRTIIKKSNKIKFNKIGQKEDFNFDIGEVDMIQGFGPYISNIVFYEDDNDEYKAISEVIDDINTYAGHVNKGARIVAAVSGPTIVSAGAGAVAVLATGVQVCAYITSAVVKIINLFDKNDHLGNTNYKSISDYVNIPSKTFDFPTTDIGNYLVDCEEQRIGQEYITRNWQFKNTTGVGPMKEYKSGVVWGIDKSDDKDFKFTMDHKTDRLINWSRGHECTKPGNGNDLGHSNWVSGPTLSNDDSIGIKARIHVGLAGWGRVEITPIVQGIYVFEKPL